MLAERKKKYFGLRKEFVSNLNFNKFQQLTIIETFKESEKAIKVCT
jgi:hypothetical protein